MDGRGLIQITGYRGSDLDFILAPAGREEAERLGLGLAYAVAGSTLEVYHADRLGSVRVLTDDTGTVTDTYRYYESGLPTASSGSSDQPFRFTGEPTDPTGLSYLRARYYDPTLGRFLARDTWAGNPQECQTLNRYAYALNDPTTRVDPSGLKSNVLDIALKCGNALGQVVLEGYSAGSTAIWGYEAFAGGELTGPGDLLLVAGTALNGYVTLNNWDWTQQSVAYCFGLRDSAPDASSASAPEFPIPPIFPGGGMSLPDMERLLNSLPRLVPALP